MEPPASPSLHKVERLGGETALPLGRYAVDSERNDLGLLFFVKLDKHGPLRLEAVPVKLEYCHPRLADCEEADGVRTPSEQPLRPWAGRQPKRRIGSSSSGVRAPLPEKSPRPWTPHKPPQLRCSGSALVTPRSPRQHRDTL